MPNGVRVRLRLRKFCTSAERLAWPKANGCPWGLPDNWFRSTNPCALAAGGGHLEALQWARQQGCPWRASTCEAAADGGHLAVLQWARDRDCPWWGEMVCAGAARGGHLSRCPPSEAHSPVLSFYGQWCSRAHFNISRYPPAAACVHVHESQGQLPRPLQHAQVPAIKRLCAHKKALHGHPCSCAHLSTSRFPV